MLDKWDLRFLELARNVAQWSKDLTTKVGAVAVSKHRSVMETGYNGLARGVDDRPERLERPAKYIWTAHAEENLITHAARRHLEGTTVYVTHLCCSTCARMLINAGVAKIVIGSARAKSMPPEQFEAAYSMLKEAGVPIIEESNEP
jgi:dCMP deaminase